jgi:hypothetical protein
MIKTYSRQILSSGEIEKLPFNETHAIQAQIQFGKSAFLTEDGLTPLAALNLVNLWNQIGGTTYKYWI